MKKKIITCLLAAAMMTSVLGGCSGQSSSAAPSGSSPAPSGSQAQNSTSQAAPAETASKYQTTYGAKQFDNVTVTVELFDRSNAPDGSTITDNKWTNYCNEQMNKVGINVEYVPVPRWDEVTKMQVMVASQTAPDLTLTYTYAYAEDYFNQGGTWDLTEFIDGADQAQNMKAYLGEDVINIGRNANNQLYGIVAKRATTAKSNLFLRKDWMDKLGLSVPTTPDELYTVIDQMVHKNPDNRSDVIGAHFWNAWNTKLAFSKLVADPTQVNISLGEDVIQEYYDEGVRECYRYMNKLYNEGLMNQEYYTWAEDNFKSYIVTGALGFFEYLSLIHI